MGRLRVYVCTTGCIGYHVRIWDTRTDQCLYHTVLANAVISLSFHPKGDMLAIGSGNGLYLWNYQRCADPYRAWQGHLLLRCVHFPPSGRSIILGTGNVSSTRPSICPHIQQTFTVLHYDFHHQAALAWTPSSRIEGLPPPQQQPALTNPRAILKRALLYNDGGKSLIHGLVEDVRSEKSIFHYMSFPIHPKT